MAFAVRSSIAFRPTDMTVFSTISEAPDDFVLLANSRVEKGFGLILEIAKRCPETSFVALANQADPQRAAELITEAGVFNVHVCKRVDHMPDAYRRAKVVAVPSYRFVETFSRICIEAHRFGKPVLGCNVGNVPNLLRQSGVILEEDAEAWAREIKKLYRDAAYYEERVALANENSKRYSQRNQLAELGRILDFGSSSMLIGVGSGIGNMLHAGPMIRNIATRIGQRVDLVVAEDHAESLFLLANSNYVNSVFALNATITQKHYHTVFLTQSFGPVDVQFTADRVIRSRDWKIFAPGKSSHETIFNLEAAKALLGVDFDDDAKYGHYISDIVADRRQSNFVGIHGGSKGGFWTSKQWPGYSELALRIAQEGFRVASFGIAGEYVPNTEDCTGGSIEEMARRMAGCGYFISNDSGLMNIANALGIPVLTLFGPTEVATRRPLSRSSMVLSAQTDCAPCEVKDRKAFLEGTCTCIRRISVEDVHSAFKTMVARTQAPT